jgi:hypothetical protein
MPDDQDEPPIRLILAAVFVHARLASSYYPRPEREALIRDSIADADEILRQVGPA